MIKTTYSLEVLGGENKEQKQLAEGIALYKQSVPAHDKTNTNEIVYWLSRYKQEFGDDYECFGFYRNDECVGFSELVYFKNERFIVIDYLTLKAEYKRNNIFYEFFEQIRSYFALNNQEIDYWIFEVFNSSIDGNPSTDDELLISLLRLQGFKRVNTNYLVPDLGLDNPQSAMSGQLMIYTESGLSYIRKELFRKIVSTIFFKHYLRWYKPFLKDSLPKYEKILNEKYDIIISQISGDIVTVNGCSKIIENRPPLHAETPEVSGFVIKSLLIVSLASSAIIASIKFAQQSMATVATAIGIAMVTYLSVLSLVYPKAGRALNTFTKFIGFFRNK